MTDSDIDHNTKQNSSHNAQEALKEFFDELEALEGMDRDVARIILRLWSKKDLGRDPVLGICAYPLEMDHFKVFTRVGKVEKTYF